MNKFIIIEGIDGSGKGTQSQLLKEYYEKKGKKVLLLDYPRYEDESSICIRRYLNGDYGKLEDISIYQASLFYAMDRLDNYLKNLKKEWNNYDIIIGNRYTTSNLIHQGAKILEILKGKERITEKIKKETLYQYKEWLENLEYGSLKLPIPNKVIYLSVTPENSLKNIEKRGNEKDLHENYDHLYWAHQSALFFSSNIRNWEKVDCERNNKMKEKEEILKEILEKI